MLDRADAVLVGLVEHEAVVPMLVEPALEEPLQVGEVDHAADVVDLVGGDVKIGDVVVAVKEFALAAVAVQPVPGAELDAAHDGEGHGQVLEVGSDAGC